MAIGRVLDLMGLTDGLPGTGHSERPDATAYPQPA